MAALILNEDTKVGNRRIMRLCVHGHQVHGMTDAALSIRDALRLLSNGRAVVTRQRRLGLTYRREFGSPSHRISGALGVDPYQCTLMPLASGLVATWDIEHVSIAWRVLSPETHCEIPWLSMLTNPKIHGLIRRL